MPEIVGKLLKAAGKPITELEKQVSQAIVDIEHNYEGKDSKDVAGLNQLYIVGVKEVEADDKSVAIIYVPVPQLKAYKKIQAVLIKELEKKLGKEVIILAKRRILPKPQRGNKAFAEKQKRPRSRTLTAVHDAWLEELVFPAEVVGKRIRVKLDGKKVYRVHLNKKERNNVAHKVDVFSTVYRKLTGKDVNFEFPEPIF